MMPAPAPPVVRLREVRHRYGDTLAADGVSLDIPAGRMVGFIGPDGVGKSTWLGLIAGARKLQHGTVEVLDAASGATRPVPIIGRSLGQDLGVVVVDVTGAIDPGDSADVVPRPAGTSTVALKHVSVGSDGFRRPR